MSADAITTMETLELLDAHHTAFAEGVAEGRYVFWLGSGISRGVVPGLDGLVRKVLEHLHAQVQAGDPDGRFRRALDKVIKLAKLNADEAARLDTDQPVAEWAGLETIVERVGGQYAQMLKIRIDDEDPDYMLWEAVDVRETFGTPRPPDTEHLCLAILGIEGVAPNMVSANWDGLIETAFERLEDGDGPCLTVAVLGQDLRQPDRRARLLKLHGCAVLAKREPTAYRAALVATPAQITKLPEASGSAALGQEVSSLLTKTRTLTIGLSAQDADIQTLHARATQTLPWPWPDGAPARVFAEDELGQNQLDVLEITYGSSYDDHRHEIEGEALVRAFGKPLLVALVIDVLARKARALVAEVEAPGMPPADLAELTTGVGVLRDLAAGAAGTGTLRFFEELIEVVGRLVALFQRGAEPTCAWAYVPLTSVPVDEISKDPSLRTNGVRELAAALALLGRGSSTQGWQISHEATAAGTHGALRVTARHERAIFFAATNSSAVALIRDGVTPYGAADAVIVHSDTPTEPVPRSPSAPVGRTGAVASTEVGIGPLLREATSLKDLERAFQLAVGL